MAALDTLKLGLAYYDNDDTLLFWNTRYGRLWQAGSLSLRVGMRYADIVSDMLNAGLYPEALGREKDWLAERVATRRRDHHSYERQDTEGRWMLMEHRRTSDGGLVCSAVDISAQKRQEAEAQEARAFLSAVVEAIPTALVVKDEASGRFALVNQACEQMMGVERQDLLGKTDLDLLPREEAEQFMARHRAALEYPGRVVVHEESMTSPNSEPRNLHTKRIAVQRADGAFSVVSIAEDVTERKRNAAALERAVQEAEAANLAKSAFLATMSHEIRTPLNGVLGMAQAMANEPLPEVQRERLAIIRQSGETLLAILNDILDLSKIEAGKLELEEAEVKLGELATGAHATFVATASKKGVRLGLEVSNEARGTYLGDSTRLRQILHNLISNALKFTEAGEVVVALSYQDGQLRILVSDTGIGIPENRIAALFERFEQVETSTTRRFGGTGLGLSICWQLTQLMGGTIQVASEVGRGSTFEVAVPLSKISDEEQSEARGERPEVDVPSGEVRLLAAEDNAVNQLVLRTLLQQVGIDPVIVDNGLQAVAAWEKAPYDLILLDVQMPEMDGPTAAEQIRRRELETGRRRTPIAGLTANMMSHQVAEYLSRGMDDVIGKPIEVTRLIEVLSRLLAVGAEGDAVELSA